MAYKEIQFHKTMGLDKRGDFAYLRHNWLSDDSKGLYPANEFKQKGSITGDIKKVIGGIIFTQNGSDINIYRERHTSTPLLKDTITGKTFADASEEGNDYVHMITEEKDIYRVSSNTTWGGKYYQSIGVTSRRCSIASFDGLYYWYISDSKIYKQLKNGTIDTAFNDIQGDVGFVDFLDDYMILTQANGLTFDVIWWDKTNVAEVQKKITEKNAKLLGMGVVDNQLMIVKSVGNVTNRKEKAGEIVVATYDGGGFKEMNSIKAGDEQLLGKSMSVGNGVLVLSINGNSDSHNETLYRDWVLKVQPNGIIETLFYFENNDDIDTVGVHYDYLTITKDNEYYNNYDSSNNYDDYGDFRKSTYITEFLNHNENVHQLGSVGVSFEKLFEQLSTNVGERLYIDYRVSERDDWTLLHEVNVEKVRDYTADKFDKTLLGVEYADDTKGMTVQSYTITKMPDGSNLPRFNEIQFRLRSWQGFSILKMWYYYEYIIRNKYVKKRT